MKLYNSLHGKVEDFDPIDKNNIRIYSCGPTVYNNLHIGNLSAFIYADVLRRTLSLHYDTVTHVMNITDVDDKTIRDSKYAYPDEAPKEALKKLTDKYRTVFEKDLKATGTDINAITFISAVDTIQDMIMLIQRLLDNNIAYITEQGIFFSIEAYTKKGNIYGLLQKIDLNNTQSRVAHDEYDKDNVSDFALWKAQENNEPAWEATFTVNDEVVTILGRPGWHIECSAMSEKLLSVPFDIHTGGIDLKFPHHENEIAQTCGAGANSLANYFFHNNHILIDGKKMSKSLGNVYTLRDIAKKGYSPQEFRLVVLESHYRKESNFSWDIMESAHRRLLRWQAIADLRFQFPEINELDYETLSSKQEIVKSHLANDVNTPEAISEIETLLEYVAETKNKLFIESSAQFIEDVLGINLLLSIDISEDFKKLINERSEAKMQKDYKNADEIREQLLTAGIELRDSDDKTYWQRIH